MDTVAKEQWALALLTARFDCAQQKFFQAEYGRRRRSPAVALALCLTLGAFGAHEFYLGRLRSAALRLLFCWTLIPLALSLAEAPFLTRRVHAYNTRMAHTLAEIVEESFAAVRAHAADAEPLAEFSSSGWQFGVARTFAPPAATRWPQETPPTTPLAEERIAPDTPPVAPHEAPSDTALTALAVQPAFTYAAVLSRRERARLGPSLDAMLADLVAPTDDAEAQRDSQPAPVVAALPPAAEPVLRAAPITTPLALDMPDTPDTPDLAEAQTSRAEESTSPDDEYAKMMATDGPLAAIMGAEPATAAAEAETVEPATAAAEAETVEPARVQRIVVRKVALVDGRPVAEARATRDVVISRSDADAEARIASATDEARAEAMRLLAAMIPTETLAQAQGA